MIDSAVLLIDCPDRKGLVARVSGLLYECGANILHADQHQDHDLGLFFMRVEWAMDELTSQNSESQRFDLDRFMATFAVLATELGMRWKLTSGSRRMRIRVHRSPAARLCPCARCHGGRLCKMFQTSRIRIEYLWLLTSSPS